MRHRKDLAKLGRTQSHRKALVGSLVRSLFLYDRIKTTLPKAKVAQRLAERLISRSKQDDLASRRYTYTHLGDHSLVKHLFEEITPRFNDKVSGFTRIFILGPRYGDGAEMAILEMTVKGEPKKATRAASKTSSKAKAKETEKSKPKPKAKTAKKEKSKEPASEKKATSKKKS